MFAQYFLSDMTKQKQTVLKIGNAVDLLSDDVAEKGFE